MASRGSPATARSCMPFLTSYKRKLSLAIEDTFGDIRLSLPALANAVHRGVYTAVAHTIEFLKGLLFSYLSAESLVGTHNLTSTSIHSYSESTVLWKGVTAVSVRQLEGKLEN